MCPCHDLPRALPSQGCRFLLEHVRLRRNASGRVGTPARKLKGVLVACRLAAACAWTPCFHLASHMAGESTFDTGIFLAALDEVARKQLNPAGIRSPLWQPLAEYLCEATDDDFAQLQSVAAHQTEEVLGGYVEQGLEVRRRNSKRSVRYVEKWKASKQKPDGRFKCLSDLAAYQVLMPDATMLGATAENVYERFAVAGALVYLCPDEPPSLAKRMYVWWPGGPIVEVFVLHPFAATVFKHDSALRDMRDGIKHEYLGDAGPIDYWANDVWQMVSQALMAGRRDDAVNVLVARGLPVPAGM